MVHMTFLSSLDQEHCPFMLDIQTYLDWGVNSQKMASAPYPLIASTFTAEVTSGMTTLHGTPAVCAAQATA